MQAIADIDTFLDKSLFYHILTNNLRWPWEETHFIIRHYCFNCKEVVVDLHNWPRHIVADMNIPENMIYFIDSTELWCSYCEFALYDHFPKDECTYCK